MTMSSSSEEKTPKIKCGSGVMSISKLIANYPVIPREELEVREQLGAGTYGSVFKGLWRIKKANEPVVIALKKVFMLEREVDILSQVRHRNIIQFFGVSQANPDFYIVTEYAENGSLFEYLHNKKVDLSFEQILKLAKQVAHGVAYLHYEAPTTIIHRDLKSRNVVLGKRMVCKICDFGTSKDLTHSYTAPTWGGTAAWMSPEIINQREGITTATDVWSYGVLLWEMFSREIPYKGLTDFKIYSITSQEGCQLLLPDTCPTHLSDLLKKCWYKNPKERIDMRAIFAGLEAINVDKRVHRECVHFVKQKEEWHRKIEEQLTKINEMELDFERRHEELKKWEQILRRRESSHRNFLHVIDLMNTTDVAEWDADCVCEWVQYMAAGKDISEQVIDKIIGRILQHEIRGSRLLQVTERDLENLGIEPASVRNYIVEKVAELNLLRPIKNTVTSSPISGSPQDDYLNFPPLNMSAELEARNKQKKTAFSHPINLIVGMYSQLILGREGRKCRFKIFLDSDWEVNEISSEIRDSPTVIKDVFMSITNLTDNTVLLESVRCVCPPFGYLEWTEIDVDAAPRISVTLAVTYTDQIIQPRNTRIAVEVEDFSSMSRILSTKMVSLKIRPFPTNTSLSRISSTMMNGSSIGESANLQGVWRARRGSIDNSLGHDSPRIASNGVVNEIIPISLMSPDIAEVHRRYQQRFVRRNSGTVGRPLAKTASPKSPLADDANSRGPFSFAASKTAPRQLQNQQRSTSVSMTPPSKSAVSRRGPSLTVMLSDKANAARQLAGRKSSGGLRSQKTPPKRGGGARIQRFRTQSEAETITVGDRTEDVSSGDENLLYVDHPKFYVCDEDSPSTSGELTTPSLSAVNRNRRIERQSPGVENGIRICSFKDPNGSKDHIGSVERKSSNLENESPDYSPPLVNGVTNGGDCKGSCTCRFRSVQLPDPINGDAPERADADEANGHSSEEFADRRYRPKPNGARKCKKSASKSKLNSNPHLLKCDTNFLKQEETEEKPSILNGLNNPDKQNTISRQVYGGYNKWRWK